MIKKQDLFKNEYLGLLDPYSFEFLNHLIGLLGFSKTEYNDLKVKRNVLNVLKYMFELDIIQIKSWMNNSFKDDFNMSIEETLNKIDSLWQRNMDFPDFYTIAYFETKEWYVNKIEDLGMTQTTDWKTFVKENIGNLEEWIEINRPISNHEKK